MSSIGKKGQVGEVFTRMGKSISTLISYITSQLQNFSSLSLGRQIAYACIGVGIILVLISLVLFIL